MSTITREHIANLIEFNSEGSDCQANAEQWEVHELARIALASLEAEHAGFIVKHKVTGKFGSWLHSKADWFRSDEYEVLSAYTAPPAPLSVTEWTNEQCLEFLSIAFRHAEIKGDLELDDIRLGVKMVNGSRAAMLNQEKSNG
ncbi:hypothetical protein [Enterobacter hormaechei]|uniref:hypothetical protein n=1 Tax=Enterobacter hormaechei TaxID=158836 RepID=UPI00125C6FB8|nr:hypothetical protein [Enterobacter hormaechei]VAG78084.1 Uncharacterised protein [Enterobacter hormaechei]